MISLRGPAASRKKSRISMSPRFTRTNPIWLKRWLPRTDSDAALTEDELAGRSKVPIPACGPPPPSAATGPEPTNSPITKSVCLPPRPHVCSLCPCPPPQLPHEFTCTKQRFVHCCIVAPSASNDPTATQRLCGASNISALGKPTFLSSALMLSIVSCVSQSELTCD